MEARVGKGTMEADEWLDREKGGWKGEDRRRKDR